MLSAVAKGLGPLKDKVVFVGGCTIGLYLTKDRKSTRLNSSHIQKSRMPSSA